MKALLVLATLALCAVGAGTAFALDAATDISDACQMQWIRDHRDGPGTIDAGNPLDVAASGVEWQVSPPSGLSSGWWDIQIGDAWDTPSAGSGLLTCYGFPVATGFADLTAYTALSLTFSNCSTTDWFMADIVLNTGWTDAPFNEPDNVYTAGWAWVPPGQTVTLSVSLVGAANLNHVSNISIKLGTTYGSTNNYDGTHICATVSPVDYVAPDPSGLCISTATPCVTVPVLFHQGTPASVRGTSVTVQLSSELMLCGAGIQPGTLFSPPWGSVLPYFFVINNGGGSYTVDYSILGLPCGPTTGGLLFTLDVAASGTATPDDVGTITVTSVIARDCSNVPVPAVAGSPALIPIDRTGPAAVTDLTATQLKTGNDSDGTTKIQVAFTAPGDATVIEVYRAPFGNYPEYDDLPGAGTVPATPTYPPPPPWTPVVLVGGFDEVAVRDFWYYTLFTKDGCGNVSAVSNQTGGTLNYHLGDVSSPLGGPGSGDNLVVTLDVSLLGANYGIPVTPLFNYLDVGPTTDFSVDGRPLTDNLVQFEDLMMFAINFATVSKPSGRVPTAAANAVVLWVPESVVAGEAFDAVLELSSDGTIQGLSVPITWDNAAIELLGFDPGDFLNRQAGRGIALSPRPGMIDAAVLGEAFQGTGAVATLRFQARKAGAPALGFGDVLVRDRDNHPVETAFAVASNRDVPVVPTVTRLLPSAPNPFTSSTVLSFALAAEGKVRVEVFAVDGSLVRTLRDEWTPAGIHQLAWDGRDDAGRSVGAGLYLTRMVVGDRIDSARLFRLR
jgi:hypothetical protein